MKEGITMTSDRPMCVDTAPPLAQLHMQIDNTQTESKWLFLDLTNSEFEIDCILIFKKLKQNSIVG